MNAGSSVKLMLVMARKKCCHIINSEWPGELNIILYLEKTGVGGLYTVSFHYCLSIFSIVSLICVYSYVCFFFPFML